MGACQDTGRWPIGYLINSLCSQRPLSQGKHLAARAVWQLVTKQCSGDIAGRDCYYQGAGQISVMTCQQVSSESNQSNLACCFGNLPGKHVVALCRQADGASAAQGPIFWQIRNPRLWQGA